MSLKEEFADFDCEEMWLFGFDLLYDEEIIEWCRDQAKWIEDFDTRTETQENFLEMVASWEKLDAASN